jgi:hypothetical protein
MAIGASLTLEEGTVIEFDHSKVSSTGNRVAMFNINGNSWTPSAEEYPDLNFTNENGVMRLEVIKTTTIIAP